MKIKDSVIPFLQDVIGVVAGIADEDFNLEYWASGCSACAIGHCAMNDAFIKKYQIFFNPKDSLRYPSIKGHPELVMNEAVAFLLRGGRHYRAGDPDMLSFGRFLFQPYWYKNKKRTSVLRRLKAVVKFLQAEGDTGLENCLKNLGFSPRPGQHYRLDLTTLLEKVKYHNTDAMGDE